MGESPKPGVLSFRRIRRLQAPRRIFLFCENFFRKRCPEVLQVLFGLVVMEREELTQLVR